MHAVFQITKAVKHSRKTFLPFFGASERMMFSTAMSSGTNATNNIGPEYGIGGQASQSKKALSKASK
ncbi:MAG: hypothetical protein K0S09_661 [Sphingobacteriaceae bacterium]|nr:hypothetical protein [Sphingobacteriaceae bacterium]